MGSIGGKRRIRAALVCAGLAAAAATVVPAAASAATALPDAGGTSLGQHGKPGYTLPEGTPKPTGDYRVQSVYKVVKGVQTYTCDATGAWGAASTPEAQLARYGRPGKIHHYAGPRWTARDGSTVVGAVDTRVPQTGTIPWLLLKVTAHENDGPRKELHPVEWISRVKTTGGVSPTGTCTPGETSSVPYGADYVFWAPA